MNKKAIALEVLSKWIIALVILGILIMGIIILREKGTNLIDKFVEIFRFRR